MPLSSAKKGSECVPEYKLRKTFEHPDGAPGGKIVYNLGPQRSLQEVLPRDRIDAFFFRLCEHLVGRIDEITTTYGYSCGFEAGGFKAIVDFCQNDQLRPSFTLTATSDNGGGDNWADEKFAYLGTLKNTGCNYTAPMKTRDFLSAIRLPDVKTSVTDLIRAAYAQSFPDQIKEASQDPTELYNSTITFPDALATQLAKQYQLVPYYGAFRFQLRVNIGTFGDKNCVFDGWVTIVFSGCDQMRDLEICCQMLEALLDGIRSTGSSAGDLIVKFDPKADGLYSNRMLEALLSSVVVGFYN